MTVFLPIKLRALRIVTDFSSSRPNRVYHENGNNARFARIMNRGYGTGDNGVAEERILYGLQAGAIRRPRHAVVSPSSVLLVPCQFLWSLIMRILKRFQPVSIVLFVLLVTFVAGFVAFGEWVSRMAPPVSDAPADAIVVLTGGQARIQAAVDLLKLQRGKRLLISGVHPSTNEKMLQRATHAEPSLFDCCVDLDRSALNTAGNAEESERWIRSNDYSRVIVVTNNYHIPRSILEMSYRMKDVEFVPYPVVNGERRDQGWVAESDTLRVLFVEYVKYLGAIVRVGGAEIFGRNLSRNGDI
ncbi:YdcF family protein [Brucella sp. BE17]|uniref:YdcF family protein n=1 Tax=Brucella sp. BE17 TaxID=3142977 RepID=UPI0031BAA8AC